jgi:hypothetical protein
VNDSINARVFSNIVGIIKASNLSDRGQQDIFAELRGIGSALVATRPGRPRR